jgi:mycofactocin system creatininase family protein
MTNQSFLYADSSHHNAIVVLPLGAWEQHGSHLPLNTDSIIINAVIQAVTEQLRHESLFIAPTLEISASDEHGGFSGTLSTGTEALVQSVVAICRSASWARGVCIANGHGGNADALQHIASALHHEGIKHSIWSLPSYKGGDMHAGHTETSLMLYLDPEAVRTDAIEPGTSGSPSDLVDSMRSGGVKSVSENGVVGDPTTATSAHGNDVFTLYTNSFASHLTTVCSNW